MRKYLEALAIVLVWTITNAIQAALVVYQYESGYVGATALSVVVHITVTSVMVHAFVFGRQRLQGHKFLYMKFVDIGIYGSMSVFAASGYIAVGLSALGAFLYGASAAWLYGYIYIGCASVAVVHITYLKYIRDVRKHWGHLDT